MLTTRPLRLSTPTPILQHLISNISTMPACSQQMTQPEATLPNKPRIHITLAYVAQECQPFPIYVFKMGWSCRSTLRCSKKHIRLVKTDHKGDPASVPSLLGSELGFGVRSLYSLIHSLAVNLESTCTLGEHGEQHRTECSGPSKSSRPTIVYLTYTMKLTR